MRHTKGKMFATALVLSAVFGIHHCSGKNISQKSLMPKGEVKEENIQKTKKVEKNAKDDLVICIIENGIWNNTVNEGDILLPRKKDRESAGGVHTMFIKKIDETVGILDIIIINDSGEHKSFELKLEKINEIGEDKKIKILANKGEKAGTVKITIMTEDFDFMQEASVKNTKNEKNVLCAFTENKCLRTVEEGNKLLDVGWHSVFKKAGIDSMVVDKIYDDGVGLEMEPSDHKGKPFSVKVGFGEGKGIGTGDQQLEVYVDKGFNAGTVDVTINVGKIKFEEKNMVDCEFAFDRCVKDVYAGHVLLGAKLGGPFEKAGIDAIKVKNVDTAGVEFEVHLKNNPESPLYFKLEFGKEKKIGEKQKLWIKVENKLKYGEVKVTLTAE